MFKIEQCLIQPKNRQSNKMNTDTRWDNNKPIKIYPVSKRWCIEWYYHSMNEAVNSALSKSDKEEIKHDSSYYKNIIKIKN